MTSIRLVRRLLLSSLLFLLCVCLFLPVLFGANPAVAATQTVAPRAPLGLVWEVPLAERSLYSTEVELLLGTYEHELGHLLRPGERAKVALKINTRSGPGLSTPVRLVRAMIEALELRGYDRASIFIIDYSSQDLRAAGILPKLSQSEARFEGCPVIALDTEQFYDADWFYDSPLPPSRQQDSQLFSGARHSDLLEKGAKERKSFLPAPLLFDVDFWVNLAVGVDDPALGVDGALANATLWNVSNSRRFLVNQATASAAVAEIAAIPELEERLVLNFISLERYQFIGGPFFNSIYSRSEPRLWMSSDPVALDRLLYDRMNAMRTLEGFPEIEPMPKLLPFAASLGLGVFDRQLIHIKTLALPDSGVRVQSPVPEPEPEVPAVELTEEPSWLKRMTPW
jgi:hypothetical protein